MATVLDLDALREVASRLPPGFRLEVHGPGVDVVVHPWCPPSPTANTPGEPAAGAPAIRLNEMEACVLEACEEAGEPLTGQQLAERSGWPWDASLRAGLAALRRRGLLSGRPGEAGYSLTPAGQKAFAAHQRAGGEDTGEGSEQE